MIPPNIDHRSIIADLNEWGIGDYKIELVCGFAQSYVGQLKNANIRQMTYQRAARLYNFWCEERDSRRLVPIHALLETTT